MPKTLFRINPNLTLRACSVPTFICYVVLYPVSRFSSLLSMGFLRLTGTCPNKEASNKAFTKMDLDYFIQSSIDETKDKEQIDTEIKIFQNALDFSNIKIRDCLIPRTEIIAVDIESTIQELKDTFIENGISKVIVYKLSLIHI